MKNCFRARWISSFLASALLALIAVSPAAADRRPVIERIEPTAGPPGTDIDVLGRYFPEDAKVRLGTTELEVRERRPGRWTVRVPAEVESGRILLVAGAREIVGPAFRVTTSRLAPVIHSIEPKHGAPGAEVVISGENFSAHLAENRVRLGKLTMILRSATPTELHAIVPEGAKAGAITVAVEQAESEASAAGFVVDSTTAIDLFDPQWGPPGTKVKIDGDGFSANPALDRVFLNGVRAAVSSATPKSLEITIPPKASTGKLLVDVAGGGRAESASPFTIQFPPVVDSFSAESAGPGGTITLRGKNFGTDVRLVSVTLAGKPVKVHAVAPDSLEVELPAEATAGRFEVKVGVLGPVKSAADFSVRMPPKVNDIAPKSGAEGTRVTIAGSGFGAKRAANRVTLGGQACTLVSASEASLVVEVPVSADSGVFAVSVEGGAAVKSAQPFVVTHPPSVTKFDPLEGPAGSKVTLFGSNFGESPALVSVTLAGSEVPVESVARDRVVVRLPEKAQTGKFTVRVTAQGSGTSSGAFAIIVPKETVKLRSIEPACDKPGCKVVLRGDGFGPKGTPRDVYFGDTKLKVLDATGGTLTIELPEKGGTSSFRVVVKDRGDALSAPFTVVD